MGYTLTQRTKDAVSDNRLQPNIVVKIDGVPEVFGAVITKRIPRLGDPNIFLGDPGLILGKPKPVDGANDYISLRGTSNSVSQQLEPDKGGASSTQSLTVRLVDVGERVTEIISPGRVIGDILYSTCTVWIGLAETSWPEDYLEIFNGNIVEVKAGAGFIDLSITHPDDKKRNEIFQKVEGKLTAPVGFKALEVQNVLVFSQFADVLGTVEILITFGAFGDNANVIVAGNIITIQIDNLATTAKTVKKAMQNDEEANQLVSTSIKKGASPTTIMAYMAQTPLSSATFIQLEDVNGWLLPFAPIFRTYARIGDEIIEYTAIDLVNKRLTGLTRQSLNSLGENHETGTEVFSFYKLGDATQLNSNAVDLALKVMLSAAPLIHSTALVSTFFARPDFINDPQSISFLGRNIQKELGVVAGDLVSSTGAVNGANNFSNRVITAIIIREGYTILKVNGAPLVLESPSTATISFRSQYNVLPAGSGLTPKQVDILEFLRIKSTFSSSLAAYEIYIKENELAKDFINEQILLPSALFSIPRKGKVSVGIFAPPLFNENSQVLDLDSVKRPDNLVSSRSVSRNFYNAVVYKYNEDSVTEKFLSGEVTLSGESTTRIKAPTRPLTIEAKGLRPSPQALSLIKRNTNRFLSQYKYGAESFPVEVTFKAGFQIEVGDAVAFGETDIKMSDINKGSREYEPRIFTVTNKSYNWVTGAISLALTDTNYSQDTRVGVFSPSSFIAASTTTTLNVAQSFLSVDGELERDKWAPHVGRSIKVHPKDYSAVYFTRIISFDPSNDIGIIVSPALPVTPAVGWQISVPDYTELAPGLDQLYKSIYCFWGPALTVTVAVSTTKFEVSPSDVAKVFVGSRVRIFSPDFSTESGVTFFTVKAIVGNEIELDRALDFTPAVGYKVDLVGFVSDKGVPYGWL